MQWSTALNAVKAKVAELDTYVDEHGTFDDLDALNEKYTPELVKEKVADTLDLLERMLNTLANDPDDIPDAPTGT